MAEPISTSNVSVFVGNLEVIASEVVHVTDNSILRLKIDDLGMTFIFNSDTTINGPSTKREVVEKELTWVLTNFKNTMGEGLPNPQKLGSAYKRALYISFWVWTPIINSPIRIINYVIYLGEAVDE